MLPKPEKRLVILLDSINTNPIFFSRSIPKIEEMLKKLVEKTKKISILELNTKDGVRIIQPLSSEFSSIQAQISKFKQKLFQEREMQLAEKIEEEIEKEAQLTLTDAFMSNPDLFKIAVELDREFLTRRNFEISLSAFLSAINYIRSLDGMKTILFISDGFHMKKGEIKLSDPFNILGGKKYFDSYEIFDKFLKLINEENVTFYTLSPKGLHLIAEPKEVPWGPGASELIWKQEKEQWERELFTIEKLAEETGGIYLRGVAKYEDFVQYLERDLTHFYEIGYKPPRESSDGKYHKIEIRVKRSDLIVRYKKGYRDFTEKELEKRNLASAFISPSFFREIEFSCKMDVLPTGDGNYQLWTRLEVPLNQFEKIGGSPEELALTLGIKEEKGEKFHMGETKLRIKDPIKKGVPLLYFVLGSSELKLKIGEYKGLIVLAQDGKRISGWETPINIQELNREPNVLNSVLGFIRRDRSSDDSPFTISKRDGALNLSRYKFYPLVRYEIKEGWKVAIFLQFYNPEGLKDFPVEFLLCNEEDFSKKLFAERIESFPNKKAKILNEIYILEFDGISPGDYKLKINSSLMNITKEIGIKIKPIR